MLQFEQLMYEIDQERQQLINDKRALRRIPEIGWSLTKTEEYLRKSLDQAGIECESFRSKILVVRIGQGPAVLIRTEMDALPVQETSGFSGRMRTRSSHVSGHDFHMAMVLALARVLFRHRDDLPGQAVIVFQPAGESGLGAKFLVERGFLEENKICAALALHLDTSLPKGQILYPSGPVTAFLNAFFIQIQGKNGPGYAPYDAVSPLEIAAQIQITLNSLLQRELSPYHPAVLSIGKAGGGAAANRIPNRAVVEGTFRCASEDTHDYIVKRIREIADGISAAYRGRASVEFISTPASINDASIFPVVNEALKKRFGEDWVSGECPISLAAEDFSYISRYVPSAFLRLGTGLPAQPGIFDEGLLVPGAEMLLTSFLAISDKLNQ